MLGSHIPHEARTLQDSCHLRGGVIESEDLDLLPQNLWARGSVLPGVPPYFFLMKVELLDEAYECLERYFQGGERTEHDSYLCRAYYARALLAYFQTKGKRGTPMLDGTLEAINLVLRGIEIAEESNRYHFLLYNGSLHYWKIARQIHRTSSRRHLIQSQGAVLAALENITEIDSWIVTHKLSHALCNIDAGHYETAATILESLRPLESSLSLKQKGDLCCFRVHVACKLGKHKSEPKLENDQLGALSLVQQVCTTCPGTNDAETLLISAWRLLYPDHETRTEDDCVPFCAVSKLGCAVLRYGLNDLATKIVNRLSKSQDDGCVAWAQVIECNLRCEGLKESMSKDSIKCRILCLSILEQCLHKFLMRDAIDALHYACRLIWKTGLPLLFSNLRRHTKTSFSSASKTLEEIESPLHKFRILLHLELSKHHADEGTIMNALDELKKCLSLDYMVQKNNEECHDTEMPLNKYLEPLNKKLMIMAGVQGGRPVDGHIYSSEDRVLSYIEKATASPNLHTKKEYTRRAAKLLEECPLLDLSSMDQVDLNSKRHLKYRCETTLWAAVAKCGWAANLVQLVLDASLKALRIQWPTSLDSEMVAIQADVRYIRAEACILALKAEGEEVRPPQKHISRDDFPPEHVPPFSSEDLRSEALMALAKASRAGKLLGDVPLCVNGAVYAWNYYKPLLDQKRYKELGKSFEPFIENMLELDLGSSDKCLLFSMVEAHFKAIEHASLFECLRVHNRDSDTSQRGGRSLPEARKFYDEAACHMTIDKESLSEGLNLSKQLVSKFATIIPSDLLHMIAHIEAMHGYDPENNGILKKHHLNGEFAVLLSKLMIPSASEDLQGSAHIIEQATHLLSNAPESTHEMWSRLSRACQNIEHHVSAVQCGCHAADIFFKSKSVCSISRREDHPNISRRDWYWIGVSEAAMGEAFKDLSKSTVTTRTTQLETLLKAMEHLSLGAQYASYAHALDLVQYAAGHMFTLIAHNQHIPTLLGKSVEHLDSIVTTMRKERLQNYELQVPLICFLLEALAETGKIKEALGHIKKLENYVPENMCAQLLCWKRKILNIFCRDASKCVPALDSIAKKKNSTEKRSQSIIILLHHAHTKLNSLDGTWTAQNQAEKSANIARKLILDISAVEAEQCLWRQIDKKTILIRCHLILACTSCCENEEFQQLIYGHQCAEYIVSILTNALQLCNGKTEKNSGLEIPKTILGWVSIQNMVAFMDSTMCLAVDSLGLEEVVQANRLFNTIDTLISMLRNKLCLLHCVSLLYLQILICRISPSAKDMATITTLQAAYLLSEIGLQNEAKAMKAGLGKYWSIDEIRLKKQQDAVNQCGNIDDFSGCATSSLCLLNTAKILLYDGQPALAKNLLNHILKASRSSGDNAAGGLAHAYLAECQWLLNEPQSALSSVKQALSRGGGIELWDRVLQVYVRLAGECHEEPSGVLKTMRLILMKVQEIRKNIILHSQFMELEATIYKAMGDSYIRKYNANGKKESDHHSAVKCYRSAVAHLENVSSSKIIQSIMALFEALEASNQGNARLDILREKISAYQAANRVAEKMCTRCGTQEASKGVVMPAYKILAQAKLHLGVSHLEMAREKYKIRKSFTNPLADEGIPKSMECFLNLPFGDDSETAETHLEQALLQGAAVTNLKSFPEEMSLAFNLIGDSLLLKSKAFHGESNMRWFHKCTTDYVQLDTSEEGQRGSEEAGQLGNQQQEENKEQAMYLSQARQAYQVALNNYPNHCRQEMEQMVISVASVVGLLDIKQTAEAIIQSQNYHVARLLKNLFFQAASPRNKDILTERISSFKLTSSSCVESTYSISSKEQQISNGCLEYFKGDPCEKLQETLKQLPTASHVVCLHMDQARESMFVVLLDCTKLQPDADCTEGGVFIDRIQVPDSKKFKEVIASARRFSTSVTSVQDSVSTSDGCTVPNGAGTDWTSFISMVDGFLSPFLSVLTAEQLRTDKELTAAIILADPYLDVLPFESCSAFAGYASVTRDLSHKIMSLRRRAQVEFSSAKFTYIVEPSFEPTNSQDAAAAAMQTSITKFTEGPLLENGKEWVGLCGSTNCSGTCEQVQDLLNGAQNFLSYGEGSLLGFLTTQRVCALGLTNCHLGLLLHRTPAVVVETPNSMMCDAYRWNPALHSACLLTLRGLRCAAVGWLPVISDSAVALFRRFTKELSSGKSVGEALALQSESRNGPAIVRVYGMHDLRNLAGGKKPKK